MPKMAKKDKHYYIVCIVETRTLDVQKLGYNTKRFYIGFMNEEIPLTHEKYVSSHYENSLITDRASADRTALLYKRCHPLKSDAKRTIEVLELKKTNKGDYEIILPDLFEEFAINDSHIGSVQKPVRWFTDVYNMSVEDVLCAYGEYLKSDKYKSWKDRNTANKEDKADLVTA